jgi:hypothetical protein
MSLAIILQRVMEFQYLKTLLVLLKTIYLETQDILKERIIKAIKDFPVLIAVAKRRD